MLYHLTQGPMEATILKQVYRAGGKLPEKIKHAPELSLGLEIYFTAFSDLTHSRQVGMGFGAIPWGAIDVYCQRNGFDDEQTEAAHYLIREMDCAWLKHHNKDAK